METKINNMSEVRGTIARITHHLNNMCNTNETEDVSANFIEAKDLLIALFKFNVERTSN